MNREQLLLDSDFDCILCLKQRRFSRQNSVDTFKTMTWLVSIWTQALVQTSYCKNFHTVSETYLTWSPTTPMLCHRSRQPAGPLHRQRHLLDGGWRWIPTTGQGAYLALGPSWSWIRVGVGFGSLDQGFGGDWKLRFWWPGEQGFDTQFLASHQ